MPRNIIVFVFLVFASMLLSGYVNTLLNNLFDLHLFFVCLSEIYLETLNWVSTSKSFFIAIICLHLQGSLPGLYLQPVQVSLVYPV